MKKTTLLMALSALIIGGCATTQPTEPIPVVLDVTPAPGIEVNFADSNVANALVVLSGSITQVGTLPKLTLQLKNITQIKLPLEYQVVWLDKDGAPLTTSSAWQQLTMTGNAARALMSIGKSPEAKQCLVSIRFPVSVEIFVPAPDPTVVQQQMQTQAQY